jgi:two-component system response regulator YesN
VFVVVHVVIVDDEGGQLEFFSEILADLRPSYSIRVFENPLDAYAYIKDNDVDVLITDVKMSDIDGIELIRKVREIKPDMFVAVFSAYSDFEYAKNAIKLGVLEYIVKPISKSNIDDLICKIDNLVLRRNYEIIEKTKTQKKLQNMLPVYIDNQIKKWIENDLPANELDEILSVFPYKKWGFVAVTKILKYRKLEEFYSAKNISQIIQSIILEIEDILRPIGRAVSAFMESKGNVIVTILDTDKVIDANNIENLMTKIIKNTNKITGVKIVIGVSQIYSGISNQIDVYFNQAMDTINYGYVINDKICCIYNDNYFGKKGVSFFDMSPKVLEEDFRLLNIEQIISKIDQIFNEMRSEKYMCDMHTAIEFFKLLCLEILRSKKISINSENYNKLIKHIISSINDCESYKELYDCIIQIIDLVIKYITAVATENDKNMEIVNACKNYIQKNYFKDISLTMLSEKFHFNAAYISHIFKLYSGVCFKEYLTEIRIKMAIKLLKTTNLKIYEIAKAIGYNDPTYFIKIFKKHVGLPPNQYRTLVDGYDVDNENVF